MKIPQNMPNFQSPLDKTIRPKAKFYNIYMVAYGPNHLKFQSRNFVSVCPHMSRNFYSQNKFYILCIRSIKLNQFSPPPWHRSNWASSPLGHQDAHQGERGHGVALQRVPINYHSLFLQGYVIYSSMGSFYIPLAIIIFVYIKIFQVGA